MIGLDTNVLLRAFMIDEGKQTVQARHLIATRCSAADPGYVTCVVLAETVWVLEANYGYGRDAIAAAVAQLLETDDIMIENRDIVHAALRNYAKHAVGFADLLISSINRAAGCTATTTFDRKAAKLDGFELVR
ncbi:MAG TPA: type II toxin-antitoxin system VapC family toxin [Rhizomicrobium sp.]